MDWYKHRGLQVIKTGITRQAQRREMRIKKKNTDALVFKHTAIANTNHNPISSWISMNPQTPLILVPTVLCPTFNK